MRKIAQFVTGILLTAAFSLPGAVLAGPASDPAITATPKPVSAIEGKTFSAVVATFTDPDHAGVASDYLATVAWGDGSTTPGTITVNSARVFSVTGTHRYAEEGRRVITVTIADTDSVTVTTKPAATIGDAGLTPRGVTLTPNAGTTFSAVVAGFADADPQGLASDYKAVINWGDGTLTSAGIIAASGGSRFTVKGTHRYASQGMHPVTVTIRDAGGSSTVAHSQAIIGPAPNVAIVDSGGSCTAAFCFVPSSLTTMSGTQVTWTNNSTAPHTVTRCDPTNCNGVGGGTGTDTGFGSGIISPSGTYQFTFHGAGSYNYYCQIHGYAVMHGAITVNATARDRQLS